MSTDLAHDPETRRPIRSLEDLEGWFMAGCKPRPRWGLGLEYELLGLDRPTGRAVPYAGEASVRSVLEGLVNHHGWEAFHEGEHPIALVRGGTHITLEPGGQTELSSCVHRNLYDMNAELQAFLRDLRSESASRDIGWIGLGLQPFTERASIGWVPKARYGIMSRVLAKAGRSAHDMMKRTAGIQVNLDYASEADATAKFRALMGIAPVITALFANSPFSGGKPTGLMSTRAAIWRETDPARCGLLRLAFEDRPFFRAYMEWALDVPMMFVIRDHSWVPVDLPFRRFLSGGHRGLVPLLADWELHLTTLFPDIRLKRCMEARCADSADPGLAMAQAALIKGIVYDDHAMAQAWQLVSDLSFDARLVLHRDVCRLGLEARAGSRPVRELAAGLVAAARQGLQRLQPEAGQDETLFLAPLDRLLDHGSPARLLLKSWETDLARDRRALVEHLSRLSLPG